MGVTTLELTQFVGSLLAYGNKCPPEQLGTCQKLRTHLGDDLDQGYPKDNPMAPGISNS
jgi:hypothetical protein